MKLSNSVYDLGKWLVLVFLPALAVFIQGLSQLYQWQEGDQWVAVVNLITVFMGSLLQLSSHYYQGALDVPTKEGGSHNERSMD